MQRTDCPTNHRARTQTCPAQPASRAGAFAPKAPRLAQLEAYIDDNIADPALGADMLQRRFCVSRPTLYRMLQPAGGVAKCIRTRRLHAAQRTLRTRPDVSITWLLYDLGFASERQFQRAFQAQFGLTPSQWRDHCRLHPDGRSAQPRNRDKVFSAFATAGMSI